MSIALDILKYSLPSLIISIIVIFVVREFFKNEDRKRRYDRAVQNRKITISMRLQAFERVLIFLERIGFDSLLKRVYRKNLTVSDLQQRLLSTIRTEFEHNFSQQLYMSIEAWQLVVKAKENSIQIINTCAIKFDPKKPAIHLSKAILDHMMELSSPPTKRTIDFLKKEAQELF